MSENKSNGYQRIRQSPDVCALIADTQEFAETKMADCLRYAAIGRAKTF